MNKHVFIKCMKIAVGSAFAIFLAELIGLEYATSAGIITLLTLQNTKQATLRLSVYRVLSYCVTIILAGVTCTFLGFHATAYGLVMLGVTAISFPMGWGDTISTNAVFCTHLFMMGKNLTPEFVWNEFLLLIIGIVIAVILNWRMPSKEKEIRIMLEKTELEMKHIMADISEQMLTQNDSVRKRIQVLIGHLEAAKEKSIENLQNTLKDHSQFYINYFDLRIQQCTLLLHFCRSVLSLRVIPEQATHISKAFAVISEHFGLQIDVTPRIEMTRDLLAFYQAQPLPTNRAEFEARALLFHGLKELEEFLILKHNFMEQLPKEQAELYLDMQKEMDKLEAAAV